MTKIYLFCMPTPHPGWGRDVPFDKAQDVTGYAIDESGKFVAAHVSGSEGASKRDMTSDQKHGIYQAAYPEGYELEWVDEPMYHKGLLEAMRRGRIE